MILKTIKEALQAYADFEKAMLQLEMIMGKENNEPLTRIFEIPDLVHRDKEIQNIYIINEVLKEMSHSEQHRVLDYFKSKYNVSKVNITRNFEDDN